MKLHPVVQHLGGIVTVTLQASFVGDPNDTTDKQRISAYGDPKVNLAGTFTGSPSFTMGSNEYYKGITTEMMNYSVRFMTQLPPAVAGQPATTLGALDCITSDPVGAATVWSTVMADRITQAMTTLRAKTPAQLATLSDSTV
jgi:hypothetical protein